MGNELWFVSLSMANLPLVSTRSMNNNDQNGNPGTLGTETGGAGTGMP